MRKAEILEQVGLMLGEIELNNLEVLDDSIVKTAVILEDGELTGKFGYFLSFVFRLCVPIFTAHSVCPSSLHTLCAHLHCTLCVPIFTAHSVCPSSLHTLCAHLHCTLCVLIFTAHSVCPSSLHLFFVCLLCTWQEQLTWNECLNENILKLRVL